MKKKISNVQKMAKKKKLCSDSSSTSSRSDEWVRNPKGKENTEPYKKRLVYGEASKSPLVAGNRNPKARSTRMPSKVTAASGKRRYIVYDESSAEEFEPTSKKAATLRRGLKISSAALRKFENELPWALKVPLADTTAFSKSNRKEKDDEAYTVCDNENSLAFKDIRRHLKFHDKKLEEIKEMLQQMVARQLVRERVHDKIHPQQAKPASRPSDCQIVSYSVWSPPGNPRIRKTPGSSAKKRTATKNPKATAIDPHQVVDAAEFMNWRRMAASSESPLSLRLPSEVVRTGTYDWFTELYDDEISLRDEHMDVLINWLVVKFEQENGASARDFSVLEMWAWGGLSQISFKRCEDDLMPYVRGSYPLNKGRAWHTVEKLYGFGHVNNDHWVGYEINLREQLITVVDSLLLGSYCIGGYFTHMSRHLPMLCEKVGLWEQKGYPDELHTPWEIVYASDFPKQEPDDKHNCGVFVMKGLEALARGKRFENIHVDHCPVYRLSYCVDLHAHSQLIRDE